MVQVCVSVLKERSGIDICLAGVILLLFMNAASAQTSATQIPMTQPPTGDVIPRPSPPFQGKIEPTVNSSTPDYPRPVTAPEGAPNVLIILLDDVGFGMTSTFGGPVPTPALDRLAANGVKYNRFHTTALCSPTRAALLTGRNHHSVGTGVIIEMGTGFPGYTGILPPEAATVAQILKYNGYATAAFGKWHNTPETEISPTGPFDRWPTGLGFGTFYGFNQGETHQYHPTLYRDVTPVKPPKTPEEGYHFTTDITDEAVKWVRNVTSAAPNRPWFGYYAPGALHAPHHAPKAWREKFKGQFDAGWDQIRETIFARQRELGVVPGDATLTPRPPEIPAWEDMSDEARLIALRLMENYAAFMAHTDFEIGRLIDSLAACEQLENTLIFYIVGDNGASAEGGPEGTFNEVSALAGYNPGVAGFKDRIDQIGEPSSEPHVPIGWAWAMNTPFQWTKQVASHLGGTRNPMVVHWPKGIRKTGELRSQFHHVIDIVPTILDVAGVQEPSTMNGISQKPMEGISLKYTFNDGDAADRRTKQYFEMLGNRAIYQEGWLASARHGIPWLVDGVGRPFENDQWELYDLNNDFTQSKNLAAKHPEKLKELQEGFDEAARQYNVYPLDDRFAQRLDPRIRSAGPRRLKWTYYGNDIRLPEAAGPIFVPLPHTVKAQITLPETGAEGVIACAGGRAGGWTLFVKEGKLNYEYNFFGYDRDLFEAAEPLPTGKRVEIVLSFAPNSFERSRIITDGGVLRFSAEGQPLGEVALKKAGYRHGVEPFEIGRDSISSVSQSYADKGEFEFTGEIYKIVFEVNVPFSFLR